VTHHSQTNPYAQEVKVERSVTMSEGKKRADYAFYLDPDFQNPRFFVEAKKPSVEIANKDSYFQAIRYGWNGGTPLAVLTDFEQFHVLDCRARPEIDTALSRAVQKYHYSDYADRDKFGAIYWLFSREAVAAGALDRYVQTQMPKAPGKFLQRGLFHGGYQGIDESFLRELDEYRGTLARAFHAANPHLDSETLTEATQRVLDRLVFLRFLEDKLIEPEPMVAHFGDKGTAWVGFLSASRRLDTVYNGNIFKPHLIDKPTFHAPDSVFGQVCSDLSSEQSPYLFSLIPIHILGSIYERFLGKVIVVDGGAARVEEKPEVRKAGGVYYTPDYIVRYIVDHTIGVQIAGKTPIEIESLRFADIACGSGSFLLGVYDALLRSHTAYYNAKAKGRTQEARKAGCLEREGSWHLSLWQKRQILLNNVWGVDIDAQAVEVAQMSLYLKLLEEETTATAHDQNLLHGAILPTLNKNIVFGNSLIGTDILEGQLFEPVEERKLNPLDFKQAFPQIMKNGGFDAIVGNPPYRMLQPHNTTGLVLSYLRDNYFAADFKIDLFHLFLQRAVSQLKPGGYLGYIVPTTLLNNVYVESLRRWLMNHCSIERISVAKGRVFADADVHTTVLNFRREDSAEKRLSQHIQTTTELNEAFTNNPHFSRSRQSEIAALPGAVWNILVNEQNFGLISRLLQQYPTLAKVGTINRGLITGERGKYFSKEKLSENYTPIIAGGDVLRYYTKAASEFVLFQRPEGAGGCWDKDVHFAPNKIVIRQIGQEPTASIVREPLAVTGNIFTVRAASLPEEIYLLGLINSKLVRFFWQTMFADFKSSFPQVTIFSLAQLPIRCIDFSNPNDKVQHDKMVGMVEQILTAKKERANALTDRDIEYWQRKCDGLDQQIDELVYALYGLTDDEIALVEGANAA
jgi:adenine-specific DNA-methyltransferase